MPIVALFQKSWLIGRISCTVGTTREPVEVSTLIGVETAGRSRRNQERRGSAWKLGEAKEKPLKLNNLMQ
jgi:hypothetical protein